MSVQGSIKRALRMAGVEAGRYRPAAARRSNLMTAHGIKTVVDVGANIGQYGSELRAAGFTGQIHSLEPLSEAYLKLEQRCYSDPSWSCERIAASDQDGTGKIFVAGNSASSSLLVMGDVHNAAAPEARTVGAETVELSRLDDLQSLASLAGPLMLKLDVQGYEAHVVRGASRFLKDVTLIESELSVRELYNDSPSMLEMFALYDGAGFSLISLEPGFKDPRDGAILQFDGFFRRSTAV